MRLERYTGQNADLFDRAFALYESAFPTEERRDLPEQYRAMQDSDYHMDFIMEGDEFLGVMLYWETDDFIFLEHFTTLPQVRNHGIGAAALGLLKQKGKTILLEIEPPVDEMSCRRYSFYQRNGFQMTPHHHIQAKYHLGDKDVELKVLSCPGILTKQEYLRFYQYMTQRIGILPRFSDAVTVRSLQEGDDLQQVAKLIYLSDKFIYPYWFDSLDDACKVISRMIDLPTLYNRDNITVAVLNGYIVGAIVSQQSPVDEHIEPIMEAFRLAGVQSDHRTERIFNDYYKKMDGQSGLYLANLAVDPAARKQGVGAAMLRYVLEGQEHCYLECIQANIGAWRLYQRMGFEIIAEYPGVFDVPCYQMVYYRKG